MYGTFGGLSSRGDRLRVGSFGERSGDAGVDAAGSSRKLSSIEVTRKVSPKVAASCRLRADIVWASALSKTR